MGCCSIHGELYTLATLCGELSTPDTKHPPIYGGPYVVIPKAYEEQVLATKAKEMEDDVTVTEIPYAETGNPYGVTVVIAS